jgi:hypothetical protein
MGNESQAVSVMAMCDQGYLCEVCGQDVETLSQSDLYLRFVIGELDPEVLHTTPERHLRCNPVLSQFIEHPGFEPVHVEGLFDRRTLDAEFVAVRTAWVTRGFARLLQLEQQGGEADVTAYPLPEALPRYR